MYYNTLDMILCHGKSNSHQEDSFHQQNGRKFGNKLVKWYMWCTAFCGAITWILRKVDQKYLESSEIWCWRKMEKISWARCVRNEVRQSVKKERNIQHKIQRKKVNRFDHALRKNCIVKHVIEDKIEVRTEVKGSRKRKRKQLLDDLRENTGYRRLKQETLDPTL